MRETEPSTPRVPGRGSNLRPLVDRRRTGTGAFTAASVGSQVWLDAISSCMDAGIGLLISRTSDGGAISITVYEGTGRARSYASSTEELAEVLAAVRDRGASYAP